MNTSGLSMKLAIYSMLHRIQEFLGMKRGKIYFEYLYSKRDDVWDYKTSEYELNKYQKSLESLGSNRFTESLEIGCSIGVFTKMLADISDSVVAIDISDIAIKKAQQECKDKNNVNFMQSDLFQFSSDKKFDLVCAAEVLYYLADDETMIKSVVENISHMLVPGGKLLYVCGSWEIDKYNDWENYFQKYSNDQLKPLNINKIPDEFNNYRISILQKVG